MLLLRRLLHALDNHGFRGLVLRLLGRLRPVAENRSHAPPAPHPFDLAHHTDTGGHIPGETLTPANLWNTAYYGISPSTLTHALQLLPPLPADATFIDLGCGKGRALLVAARFPFPRILGIELSPRLAAIARHNTAFNPRIEIQQADAVSLTFPSGPLVLFLYHPFLAPLLRRLLRNLHRQLESSPRPIFLLYANLTYPRVFARFPFLRQVWEYNIPLSAEDAAADRHGTSAERYTLFQTQ